MNHEHTQPLQCNFCGKHKTEVDKLIVANDSGICNDCVDLCWGIINRERMEKTSGFDDVNRALNPMKLKEHLDSYIVGQDAAKIALSVAITNHYKRIFFSAGKRIEKSNVLIFGPTGSGKTMLARTVADYLNVPFVIADATTLTESGYVGDDVESVVGRLLAVADYDVELCQRGIVFLDEVDKISRKSESASITRDVSGEGVQQALLKLVEGTTCLVPVTGTKKHPQTDQLEVNTTNILFIAAGAFVDLEKVVERRIKGGGIGFGATPATGDVKLSDVEADDLIAYGMIPEFTGRFPVMVHCDSLTVEDLIRIISETKNSLIDQYKFYFDIDTIDLEFDKKAIRAIAEQAIKTKTGARGLKSIIERILMPLMYNIPVIKEQGHKKIVITEETVKYADNPKFLE